MGIQGTVNSTGSILIILLGFVMIIFYTRHCGDDFNPYCKVCE